MKLRNIINIFCAVGVAAVTTGCTNEDLESNLANDAVTFTAYVGDPQPLTRANLYLSQWVSTRYVAIKSGSKTKKYMALNPSGNKTDLVVQSGDPFYWGTAATYAMEAWLKYTYTTTHPTGQVHTLQTSYASFNDLDKDVFCYASGSYSRTNNAMKFYHQNALLTFELHTDSKENAFSPSVISAMTIGEEYEGASKLYTQATWTKPASGATGTWSAHKTPAIITCALGNQTAYSVTFKSMAIPYNYTKGVCFKIITTNGTYYGKLPTSNWEAGKHYQYTLTLHAGFVEVTNVSVTLGSYAENTTDLWQSENTNITAVGGVYTEAETSIFK